METIEHDGKILAIVCRDEEWSEGLNFITPDHLFIQAGTWHYPKGKVLASHIHKPLERTVDRTHEMVYVRKGSVKALLYDKSKNKVKEIILKEGDTAILAYGGHGYEILEDGTQVLEVKNGPFVNVELDKEKF